MPPPTAPQRAARSRARATRRPAGAAALLVAVALTVGACGGSSSSTPETGPSSPPGNGPGTQTPTPTVALGKVAGNLHQPNRRIFKKHRKHLLVQVGGAVDRWIQGGFLGVTYPTGSFPTAFRSFTGAAQRDARLQKRLLTNSKLGKRIDGVHVKKQEVVVDVLAPHGRPAGVTAHVRLVFTTSGRVHQRVTVTGRLFLAPDKHGSWKVFGYDVARGER